MSIYDPWKWNQTVYAKFGEEKVEGNEEVVRHQRCSGPVTKPESQPLQVDAYAAKKILFVRA
jgi:hypothetical protein